MRLFRHPVAALVLFAVLIGLCINIYEGLQDNYSVVKGDVKTMAVTDLQNTTSSSTGNIIDQFNEMNLIEGINDIQDSLLRLETGAGLTDVFFALLFIGIGAVKVVLGILTAPYTIMSIIFTFYAGEIPGVIAGLASIVIVYAAFIWLSLYLQGKDV